MTPYDFVHLVLFASDGSIEGRTKLQKVVYFAGVLTKQIDHLGYRAHFYGPFSPLVAGAIEELRGLKFLEQRTVSSSMADQNGFEKIRYDYVLTEDGRVVAEEKSRQFPKEWEQIKLAVERLKTANITDYVRLAIAAKTYLLTQQVGRDLPSDELRAKAAEHGWTAFNDEQYTEAMTFLLNVVGTSPLASK